MTSKYQPSVKTDEEKSNVLASLLLQPHAEEPEVPSQEERLEKFIKTKEKFDITRSADGSAEVEAKIHAAPSDPDEDVQNRILSECGYDPAEVRITGDVKVSHWQAQAKGGDVIDMRAYKFSVAPVSGSHAQYFTIPELAEYITSKEPATPKEISSLFEEDPRWFVFQVGDAQIGKGDQGGTEEIIARYMECVKEAVKKFQLWSSIHPVEGVQISSVGDAVEGNCSQNGRTFWRTDLTVTEQVLLLGRLYQITIDAFLDAGAPMIYLDVVNGNHDEMQRFQDTRPGDGHATAAATSISRALELNPERYGLVEVRIPDPDQGHMTVPVGSSIVTLAHGHQWRRGKAEQWFMEQSYGRCSAGEADILQHGHEHAGYYKESSEQRSIICSSTLEMRSDWFWESHGHGKARRGGFCYLIHKGTVDYLTHI